MTRRGGLPASAVAAALAMAALITFARALDLGPAMATGDRLEMFAMVLQGVLALLAGIFYYVTWRMREIPAFGWLAAALIFLGLQDFPFLLAQFADPVGTAASDGEGMEVAAAGYLLVLFVCAAQQRTGPWFSPLSLGIAGAVVSAALRFALINSDAPAGFVDGTALAERLAVGLLCLATLVALLRTRGHSRYTRTVFSLVVLATGVQCILDTGAEPTPAWSSSAVTSLVVLVVGLLMLDASIRALLDSLEADRAQMEALARRALNAEAQGRTEADILHEVRSTVGGLATASELLTLRQGLSPSQRESLEHAFAEELGRVNRTLHGTTTEVQVFDIESLVRPLIEFHRAEGLTISWQCDPTSGLIRHVPDSVAQVLGGLLHNAQRHAPGQQLTVRMSRQDTTVRVSVSQPGPEVDPSVLPTLFHRGTRGVASVGEGLGLSTARALMREHGGDLALAESSPHRTTFVISIPGSG